MEFAVPLKTVLFPGLITPTYFLVSKELYVKRKCKK
jgi:hypothetical protein